MGTGFTLAMGVVALCLLTASVSTGMTELVLVLKRIADELKRANGINAEKEGGR